MHESHAVESIFRQVIKEAEANHASRISRIKLVVGRFLGFEESSTRLYFETISEGTIASGAQLQIEYATDSEFYVDSIEIEEPLG